ncbi:MAG: bifunctional [glutamine synthetase] adenylyltransferase/[glutamine synthetase]-adenylyl-L-tyrosine phosphorylase, partial [Hyphomicrobiales bacterium]
SMLRNHENLRSLLVALMASAPRMADAVIHRAHVMDSLIDPAFADARDYQDVIDRARILGQEQLFLIAAGLLAGSLDAKRAGEQFTTLAEALLLKLFDAVRSEFEKRHGVIPGAKVALLAFGKMASREMTARSDLDFIMLYDLGTEEESNGEKPLAASQYYARLTQRLIAAVSAPTSEGVLYQADMRLRPSGNAGPLATSLAGFNQYHHESAWTWEHLALSRARLVQADHGLGEKIDAAIAEILSRPRDAAKTIDDVLTMRALMAKERPPRHAFDLKLARGGLIDLEFIAQSAQLVARDTVAAPQAPTDEVLRRLGQTGLVPQGERLAEILGIYSTVLQVMSAALADPFKDEGWT